LKPDADPGLLLVEINDGQGRRDVRVRISWSDYFRRWIPRTEADTIIKNNLDNLPNYAAARIQGSTTYFDQCSV
jgi:hypothetical protein